MGSTATPVAAAVPAPVNKLLTIGHDVLAVAAGVAAVVGALTSANVISALPQAWGAAILTAAAAILAVVKPVQSALSSLFGAAA